MRKKSLETSNMKQPKIETEYRIFKRRNQKICYSCKG